MDGIFNGWMPNEGGICQTVSAVSIWMAAVWTEHLQTYWFWNHVYLSSSVSEEDVGDR